MARACAPPNIVAVATLIKYSDAQRTETREAIAYNLLPEHKIFDWQIGFGGGGLDSGVGLIAIPSLVEDLDGTRASPPRWRSRTWCPKPGFTDFAIYIYDQNGLLDYVCEKLNEKQVEYIDLADVGLHQQRLQGLGDHLGRVLGARGVRRHGLLPAQPGGPGRGVGRAVEDARSATDVAGDEAAGSRGIPFQQSDIEDEEFEFSFLVNSPLCPGLPGTLPKPGECDMNELDQTITFLMSGANVRQYTILDDVGAGGACFNTGVSRIWADEGFEFEACGNFQLSATCTAQTLVYGTACGAGVPMGNALLYSAPNVSGDECLDLLDTSVNTTAGTGVGLMLNQPYTFSDIGGSPLTLGPGAAYYFQVHSLCDTFPPSSTGDITIELDFESQ